MKRTSKLLSLLLAALLMLPLLASGSGAMNDEAAPDAGDIYENYDDAMGKVELEGELLENGFADILALYQ